MSIQLSQQQQLKELEKHLHEYHSVDPCKICFSAVNKNNLLSNTFHFKTFTVRYTTTSSGGNNFAAVNVLN